MAHRGNEAKGGGKGLCLASLFLTTGSPLRSPLVPTLEEEMEAWGWLEGREGSVTSTEFP